MRTTVRILVAALLVALAAPVSALADGSGSGGGTTLFIRSAHENGNDTVTLPLHRGTSGGQTVWFVVLDASDGNAADRWGVNTAQKLANARDVAGAVQKVTVSNGTIDFRATVDFSPVHAVAPGPTGFPPAQAVPGSVANAGYSPLIQLPDGTILNAPQIANASGRHDKVVAIDFAAGTVTLRETNGEQGGRPVRYVSTDSSFDVAAALEGSTYVPALNAAPFAGGDGTDSARASLAAFVNGQTGAGNPNRQGLNSALLDGLDPVNVLAWNPSQGRYSPLWDVNASAWSPLAIALGLNTLQNDFFKIAQLGERGLVTAPDGSAFGASGFIVDCPIVSRAG